MHCLRHNICEMNTKANHMLCYDIWKYMQTYIICIESNDKIRFLTRPAMNIELDITCHVFASQLSGHCVVIANQLWRHQQNLKRASETRGWCACAKPRFSAINGFVMSCKNEIMYALLWRTVNELTRGLFWCLFLSLLCNSGNKRQANPLVSA